MRGSAFSTGAVLNSANMPVPGVSKRSSMDARGVLVVDMVASSMGRLGGLGRSRGPSHHHAVIIVRPAVNGRWKGPQARLSRVRTKQTEDVALPRSMAELPRRHIAPRSWTALDDGARHRQELTSRR